MKIKNTLSLLVLTSSLVAQSFSVKSPDQKLSVTIDTKETIRYSVTHEQDQLIQSSPIALTLSDGTVWGTNTKLTKKTLKPVSATITTPVHFAAQVHNNYNELTLEFRGNWGIRFRAYNDGMAYRFFYTGKKKHQHCQRTG